MSSHNSHFDLNSQPRHSINSERAMTDARIVPRPTMMWYV